MNVKHLLFASLISLALHTAAQEQWKPVEGKIATEWSQQVTPENAWKEYPRPQMVRDNWINLNGLWDYAITPLHDPAPKNFQGKILVPFAIESSLSGVEKTVGSQNQLWYKRNFTIPASFKKQHVLLHFGAVDWKCDVYVNGVLTGSHEGGYDPFYFDITRHLSGSGTQEIIVSVWDPSDEGVQPRGKQVKSPRGIWYTPVTGIWQTVWLEPVPETFIMRTLQTPDIDNQILAVKADISNKMAGDKLIVSAWDGQQQIAGQETDGSTVQLHITNPKLWSPENPFLYGLRISVVRKGKAVDEVKSYFAMRKISMSPDGQQIQRMMLNDEFVFQYGPLDQGWWPDGLYTAPNDEALKFDIQKTKDMGFNMIRKHVKVEPARWYYYCDTIGMLVWQDMPSGDMGNHWESRPGIIGLATEKERTKESEAVYRKEWKAIIDATYNFPSIVVWVPFNEGWGQFKTKEIVGWTTDYDPSRLVNQSSGGNFYDAGHILDLHNYPSPCMPDPLLFGAKQIIALGEFGGLGLPLEGHTWQSKNNWGYQNFQSQDDLFSKYESFINTIPALILQGLSAAIYTQTTDVEIEVNGLMTYDRKVVKMPEAKLKALHDKLYAVKLKQATSVSK